MLFACDPYQNDLQRQLETGIARVSKDHPGARLYALIDGATHTQWGAQILAAAQKDPQLVQSLYRDTSLQDAQECSPFLCLIKPHDIGALLTRAASLPLLSLLQSDKDIDALRTHFAPFLLAGTGDAQWFPVRWGYPLAVSRFLEVFGPQTTQSLCSGFWAWHLINREGGLHTIAGLQSPKSGAGTSQSDQRRLTISQKAFAALVDAGEADAMLIELFENFPQLIRGRRLSGLYSMATEALQAMTRRGIEAQTERRKLLITVLSAPDPADVQGLVDAYVVRRQNTPAPSKA